MRLSDALENALDHAIDDGSGPGPVVADLDGRSVEVDVVDVDRLGIRVRGVEVQRDRDYDVGGVAERWPSDLRELPDRVEPVEVEPGLGGATLRSRPDERRDDTFVEVEVRGDRARVRRMRAPRGGEREDVEWSVTREQLGRLVDTLDRG